MKIIRALVIDDSLFMRQILTDILTGDGEVEVVAAAHDGKEGVELIEKFKPDVVTLDFEMPVMDGVATLKKIMRNRPTPVVMISAYTKEGAEITLEALSMGAVDFVAKPSGSISLDLKNVGAEIVEKVKKAASANLKAFEHARARVKKFDASRVDVNAKSAILIGASTGGTVGVEAILRALPSNFTIPILIVQHMPEFFTEIFANRLDKVSKLKVKEGEDGEEVRAGTAYIAPGNWHMEIEKDSHELSAPITITLNQNMPVFGLRPSVDKLMQSAASVYKENALGILLSGMGTDGVKGMEAVDDAGGFTIAQDEETSAVFGMPCRAIEAGVVDEVLPISNIPYSILKHFSAK
jgi:two-component system, chemotaxis family, protein-glutamate methylesterase/glutaminase